MSAAIALPARPTRPRGVPRAHQRPFWACLPADHAPTSADHHWATLATSSRRVSWLVRAESHEGQFVGTVERADAHLGCHAQRRPFGSNEGGHQGGGYPP